MPRRNIHLFDRFRAKIPPEIILPAPIPKDEEFCEVIAGLDKVLGHAYEHDLEEVTLPTEFVMQCRHVLSKFD